MIGIKLTRKGIITLIDDADYDLVFNHKWYLHKCGNSFYASAAINNKFTYLHRFLMGVNDKDITIDHIDGDGLNNQRNNLRLCTKAQNNINTSSNKNTTSKYKGVSWAKHCNRWRAQICKDKVCRYIGYYDTEIEAALAYNNIAKTLHGEFANLNKL